LPNAPQDFLPRRILLIKPGYPFLKSLPSRSRNSRHAPLRNPISEEGKSLLNPPYKGLVRVLLHPQFPERLINHANRSPEAPARRSQNHPIVHEAGVGQAGGLHAVIHRQISRPGIDAS
jgi:hypothetical protein